MVVGSTVVHSSGCGKRREKGGIGEESESGRVGKV